MRLNRFVKCLMVVSSLALIVVVAAASRNHESFDHPGESPRREHSVAPYDPPHAASLPFGSAHRRLTRTTQEMVGALVGDPGEECELLELVWGITSLDRVEVARIAARDARGKLLEHRSSETFVKTTTEVGDLQGCHMRHDGGFLKVFNIQYAVDVDGRLVVALLECEDEDGNV